ncbi:hypothetical protein LUZ60_002443 [Juncus effusus]|nr:hypothetical protein LUZ60_002443 [Juncus effusus]
MEIESTESSEWIPKVGMEFDTIESAWDFWVNYGNRMGFGVRKHFINKCKRTGKISSRGFLCSNEGRRINDKRDKYARPRRPETRTGCEVGMSVKLVRESNKYRVYEFKPDHNHDLQAPGREIVSQSQQLSGAELEIIENSVIGPNFLPSRRQRELNYMETDKLISYFYEKSLENPSFIHTEQLDAEEKITNIFWADSQMCIDYMHFGDVVLLDTSNCQDLESRPLCVFLGLNNYREIVVFGAGLIYDMRIESFKWLFESFLKTHNLKNPKTLFTEPDPIMERALMEIMPETVHGFGVEHLMQDVRKHLSRYNNNKDNLDIVNAFRVCMCEYFEVGEFEEGFNALKRKVGTIGTEPWLDGIYKVKDKWAQCFMKQALTLGIQNEKIGENFFKDLKNYLKIEIDIIPFFKQFERVVSAFRQREIDSEIVSRRRIPFIKMKTPILIQASRIYNPKIFEIFQDEYEISMGAYVKPAFEGRNPNEFLVSVGDLENESHYEKCFKVIGNASDQIVTCNCNKFQSFGILCGHALKVLDLMNIKLLPDKYILKRWTKEARTGTGINNNPQNSNSKLNVSNRHKILCQKFFKIAARAANFEESFVLLDNLLVELEKQVEGKVQTVLSASPLVPNLNVISRDSTGLESMNSRGGVKKLASKKRKKASKKSNGNNEGNNGNGNNNLGNCTSSGNDLAHATYKEITNAVGEMNYEAIHADNSGNGVHPAYSQLYIGGVSQPTHGLDNASFNQGPPNLSLHYATNATGLPNWLGH